MSDDPPLELINVLSSWIEKAKQRQEFIKGIAFGLFYGIIGNMAASHYYGLFEGLTKATFDNLFLANLISLSVALAVILLVSRRWFKSLAKLDAERQYLRDMIVEVLEKKLKEQQEDVAAEKK